MKSVLITGHSLTLEELVAVSRENAVVELSQEAKDNILASRAVVDRLENIVFLELFKRYDGKVWVGKNYEKEIDFVCKNLDGTLDYYQVAETAAGPETLARELSSIENTGDKYRKTLLTLDLIVTDESGVAKRNIVNWLCDNS